MITSLPVNDNKLVLPLNLLVDVHAESQVSFFLNDVIHKILENLTSDLDITFKVT